MNSKIARMTVVGTWVLACGLYAPAPNNIAETVIAKSKGKGKIDEE